MAVAIITKTNTAKKGRHNDKTIYLETCSKPKKIIETRFKNSAVAAPKDGFSYKDTTFFS